MVKKAKAEQKRRSKTKRVSNRWQSRPSVLQTGNLLKARTGSSSSEGSMEEFERAVHAHDTAEDTEPDFLDFALDGVDVRRYTSVACSPLWL